MCCCCCCSFSSSSCAVIVVLDRYDDQGRAGIQWAGPGQEWLHINQGAQAAQQEDDGQGDQRPDEQGGSEYLC